MQAVELQVIQSVVYFVPQFRATQVSPSTAGSKLVLQTEQSAPPVALSTQVWHYGITQSKQV